MVSKPSFDDDAKRAHLLPIIGHGVLIGDFVLVSEVYDADGSMSLICTTNRDVASWKQRGMIDSALDRIKTVDLSGWAPDNDNGDEEAQWV